VVVDTDPIVIPNLFLWDAVDLAVKDETNWVYCFLTKASSPKLSVVDPKLCFPDPNFQEFSDLIPDPT